MIALGVALLFFTALILYCFSTACRTRSKRVGSADHDLEAAVPNEACSEPSPAFIHPSIQYDHPGSVQNFKDSSRSTRPRTYSVPAPYPVYAPNNVGNCQRERSRSLSSLSSSPLSRAGAEPFPGELYPPPEYSFLPGSPRNPTPSQPIVQIARLLEASDGEKGLINHASALSAPDISWLSSKPAEWSELPLSHSQPATKGISGALSKTARDDLSMPSAYTPWPSPAPAIDDIDQHGRILPRSSISSGHGQATGSDSVVTISSCDKVAAGGGGLSGAEGVQSCSSDDLGHAASTETPHRDEGGRDRLCSTQAS